jgi:DNA-binding GntR family transcriptional regulator
MLLGSEQDGRGFVTKSEYVAQRLREMVISGELRPGAKVRQQEVATAFDVSPTPVREAIRQLEAEGYLESTPHMSAQVAQFDYAHLDEVYWLRGMLEGALARKAISDLTPVYLERLRALNAEFAAAVANGDRILEQRLNYRLHHLVWERAHSPITLGIIESLWAKFPQVLSQVPGRGKRSVVEHERLLQALEARDGNAAEVAVRSHIASGRDEMLKVLGTDAGTKALATSGTPANR